MEANFVPEADRIMAADLRSFRLGDFKEWHLDSDLDSSKLRFEPGLPGGVLNPR